MFKSPRRAYLEELLDSFQEIPFSPHFFEGHQKISLGWEDYRVRAIRVNNPHHQMPQGVKFNAPGADPKMLTDYGLVIQAPKKGNFVDVVVLGFNLREEGFYEAAFDCIQIQGGHNRYREQTPINGHEGLLIYAMHLAFMADADLLVPSWKFYFDQDERQVFDPETRAKIRRFERIYDQNATKYGFLWNDKLQRYLFNHDRFYDRNADPFPPWHEEFGCMATLTMR